LVLLPLQGKPLHVKYQGPNSVEQQLGPADYVISTPDHRKTKRVCHVNLLKAYHERDPELDPSKTSVPVNVLVQSSISVQLQPRFLPQCQWLRL